jgi:molybdate transport system substrate-binding protein
MRGLWVVLLAGCGGTSPPCEGPLLVFAAASLRDALSEVTQGWTGGEVRFNFAGSNVLAMQVEATQEADLFISADQQWMDRLERANRLVEGTRRDLLANRLVVIVHSSVKIADASPTFLFRPGIRHLSLADPDAVPAGRYAKDWLERSGLWTQVATKVAPAADVRAAMRLVEADSSVAGVVYATDARASERVRVVFEVDNGPEIRYPAALVAGPDRCPASQAFLDHLEASDRVFTAHGFEAL